MGERKWGRDGRVGVWEMGKGRGGGEDNYMEVLGGGRCRLDGSGGMDVVGKELEAGVYFLGVLYGDFGMIYGCKYGRKGNDWGWAQGIWLWLR